MRNWHIWLLIVLVITGGAVIACKSSKKSTTTKPTATQSNATKVSNATTVVTTPSSTGGNASAQLTDLESKAATKEAKVAYTYTSTPAGGTAEQGTFTLYSKPPDWRFDFTSGGTTGSIISAGGNSYLCTPDNGGTCIQSSALSQVPLPFFSYFTDPKTLSSLIGADVAGVNIDRSSKTIAGQSADCFNASGSAAGAAGSGEFCFSSDGILLSLTANSAGSEFSLEATSVGSVSNSDLTPPYPIQSVPGLP